MTSCTRPARPALFLGLGWLALAGFVFCPNTPLAADERVAATKSEALARATPESQGISSSDLLEFLKAVDTQVDSLHSFMLVRHGQVVAEGWWTPYDGDTRHVLYSLSKSFTSTAVGIAIGEGKFTLDDEVLKFFPDEAPAEASPNLRSMRVSDLLRMSAGHQSEPSLFRDEPGFKSATDSWTKRFLAHPVPFKPGTHFLYNTPATFMLSAIVQKATGMPLHDYLGPRLYAPLGIEQPVWLASPDGVSLGGFGLLVRTEDIARFGQLYLQRGTWQGRQLVPSPWIEAASTRQTSNGSSPRSDWDQGYGYQFWRCRNNAYRGDGAFGQYCIVLPDEDAVIAITGGLRDMQLPLNLIWDRLLPAMRHKALPEDAAAQAQLKEKLSALTIARPSGQASQPLADKVSGRWYEVPDNPRGIQAIALDFQAQPPSLAVRTAAGASRTSVGLTGWEYNLSGFTNGVDRYLGVPPRPAVAAAGAWTAADTFTIKIVVRETPFVVTLAFRFDGDRLVFDSEHNVAFGPTKQPQLVGQRKVAQNQPGGAGATAAIAQSTPRRVDAVDRLTAERLEAVHQAVAALASQRHEVPRTGTLREYRANLHVHSALSHDSRGRLDEIVAAAHAAGSHIIMFTEHPAEHYDFYVDGHQGIRDGVLLIPGAETKGLLAYPRHSVRGLDQGTPQEFVDIVRGRHGLTFLSHLEERLDWELAGLTGVEIYNTHADFKDEQRLLAALRNPLWLLSTGELVRRYPQEALSALQDYPAEYLRRWDQLCQRMPLTGVSANDAHQNIGITVRLADDNRARVESALGEKLLELDATTVAAWRDRLRQAKLGDVLFEIRLDRYEHSLRHVGTHLLLEALTVDAVWQALEAGRAFVAFDWMADATGFDLAIQDGDRRIEMGGKSPWNDRLQLVGRAPLPARWKLIRDGQPLAESAGSACDWTIARPGNYRVELWLDVAGEPRPWILSNPFHVTDATSR